MKKNIIKFIVLVLAVFFTVASFAEASTPNVILTLQSDGDNVQLQIAGDNSAPANLYYTKTGVGPIIYSLGTTTSSGSLVITLSSSALGITSGSTVHVAVNSQNSQDVTWPTVSSSSGALILNQYSIVTTVGQSTNVTATNYNSSNPLYLSNNSNPQVANIFFNGNQITVSAISNGSTTATICRQGISGNCANLYVTVQTSGSGTLTFSQTNLTIATDQTIPITIYGGTGYYMVLNNSNPSLIQTSINGSTINLNVTNTAGSGSVTVCSTNNSSCGIINITAGSTSSSAIVFSQQNPSVNVGQNLNVSVSGGSSNVYYISSNSNTSVLQATISGSTMTLTGNTNGSSSVTVCSSTGSCGVLNVAVNYVSSGGPISLSQNYLSVLTGQTLSVTINGGTAPYNTPISINAIYNASISGNILSVYGKANGTGIVDVCSAEGGCTILNVTISGSGTSSGTGPSFSQNNLTIYAGQSSIVSLSGTGGYYISNNSNSAVAIASISGANITINASSAGNSTITVCQSGGQCNYLYVTVYAGSSSGTSASNFLTFSQANPQVAIGQTKTVSIYGTSSVNYTVVYNSNSNAVTPTMSGAVLSLYGKTNGPAVVVICDQNNNCGAVSAAVGSTTPIPSLATNCPTTTCPTCPTCPTTTCPTTTTTYKFTRLLGVGDNGDDVLMLQKRLQAEGVYSGPLTGTFGSLTKAGVKAYQAKYGISQVGNMGPATMAQLNK